MQRSKNMSDTVTLMAVLILVGSSSTGAWGLELDQQLGIRFHGLLPGSVNRELEGTFEVEFKIYRSPQGGEPIWRETREVKVADGWMDVMLGTRKPIPLEIHELTFKFLGASVNGNREVYPRCPIVNVVFVSKTEAMRVLEERKAEEVSSPGKSLEAYAKAPGFKVSEKTAAPATWRKALEQARESGGTLADYEDWYRSLEMSTPDQAKARTDHYEWVLPWVYDTASHGRYNRYFRGRFEGCDYMDLSPQKSYVYRIAASAGDRKRAKTGERSEEQNR